MARYIGPKNKLSRREGLDLFNKGSKLRRATVKPGMHGAKRAGKMTEYGIQLRAKQRAKRLYGVMEKQFRNYVLAATKSKTNVRDALVSLLERRLDNVVYRLGFTSSRPAARQLVSHGHVRVDGLAISIPSYNTKVGEKVSLDDKALKIPDIERSMEERTEVVSWLQRDDTNGKIIREPVVEDLKDPISLADIIEFYSR